MKIEKLLKEYNLINKIEVAESKLQETVIKSMDEFYNAEQYEKLSYREFLWVQLKLVQKRWWVLQFIVLCLTGITLVSSYDEGYIQRGMGIMAALFIILIIPEFWKNRTCKSIEVEDASYFSLRQIYSSRLVLFGGVDLLLLTMFCGITTIVFSYEIANLIIQFILPMLVTACICFGALCSKKGFGENIAIILSVLWSGIWTFVTMNEAIYTVISLPIWFVFIGIAVLFLCASIYRTVKNSGCYWEVTFNGTEIR